MRMLKTCVIAAGAATALNMANAPAHAASDPLIGEIMMVGFNYCPRGWANADGQLLPISTNMALFSLYGTTYGGDGRTTFGLPDLRGRVAMHAGKGPGLPDHRQGEKAGGQNVKTDSGPGSIEQPAYQVVRFCVALQGIFPSRN